MLDLDSTAELRDDIDDAQDHGLRRGGSHAQQVSAVRSVPRVGQRACASGRCLAAVCVRYRSVTTVAAGELLRLLIVSMFLGWKSVIGRSGRALERMLRSKNSVKESWVAASGKRHTARVTSVPGTMRVTEIFKELMWNRASKGCLVKHN